MAKKILITGANYKNKGAQSMLFVTIEELRKRMPDCEIYFGCLWEDQKLEGITFKQVHFGRQVRRIYAGKEVWSNFLIAIIRALISMLRGKFSNLFNFMEMGKYLKELDYIIDVSGFAIGDKWRPKIQEGLLDSIRIAKKYNIPIYLMPQSFGPFNYSKEDAYIKDEIKDLFPYVTKIFAREVEGYEYLVNEFELKNVVLSQDIVLQCPEIHVSNIYDNKLEILIPNVETKRNVGIIPNEKLFLHGDEEKVLNVYNRIIDVLLDANYEVYLFRHSVEDLKPVMLIGSMYKENTHIHVIKDDLSCLEYEQFIKYFDFIICSRFHGVVHAYRKYIPVLILGWAVKYIELAASVKQSEYVFNVIDSNCDIKQITLAVEKLMRTYKEESKVIKECMEVIQRENCFDLFLGEE